MSFSMRNFVKNGFLKAVGKTDDYWVILNAAGWLDKGVLLEEDLVDIQTAIDAHNAALLTESAPDNDGVTPSDSASGNDGVTPSESAPDNDGVTPADSASGNDGVTPADSASGNDGVTPAESASGNDSVNVSQ